MPLGPLLKALNQTIRGFFQLAIFYSEYFFPALPGTGVYSEVKL